jgi:hypothetical protein
MSSKNSKRKRRITGTSIMFETLARKVRLKLH